MRPEEREQLLAAFALGTLSEPDGAVVRDLVRSDPAAADELAVVLAAHDSDARGKVAALEERQTQGG